MLCLSVELRVELRLSRHLLLATRSALPNAAPTSAPSMQITQTRRAPYPNPRHRPAHPTQQGGAGSSYATGIWTRID